MNHQELQTKMKLPHQAAPVDRKLASSGYVLDPVNQFAARMTQSGSCGCPNVCIGPCVFGNCLGQCV
jgi:hypothetical protein